jgi:FkbM family methyltransferase
MIQRFKYFKYYTLAESLQLLFYLALDFIYQLIPKKAFLIKNTYDELLANNAIIARKDNQINIKVEGTQYVLRLPGSDFEVFNQIVLNNEYKTVLEFASRLNSDCLHIVDCGANIGLTTLMFKKQFPNAKIICIEPEPENYQQLCKNIENNKLADVIPLQCGVWHKKTILAPNLTFRDRSNWAFALKEIGNLSEGGIQVDSLSNIISNVGWSHIDVLKIDIEGSEFAIFRNLDSWKSILETAKIVSIEVHNEMGTINEIENILMQNGFTLRKSGELLIGIKASL